MFILHTQERLLGGDAFDMLQFEINLASRHAWSIKCKD